MSISIRISPQASKVLAFEARSTASDATVIRMRVRKSFVRRNSSKVMPLHYDDDSVIINMIHDAVGAKAPSLVFEGTMGGP